jgi:hypothetical protein
MAIAHPPLPGLKLFAGGQPVEHETCSQRGKRYPAEWKRFADPLTGREITQFTSSCATDQHPYFTGPAVTADGSRLVFISDRTGNPNLFSLDMQTGEILQLTDNRYGTLRQYVFSWGNLNGFGKSSVVLNARTGNVYFMQGRQVRRVNAFTGEQHAIAELPPGWVTSFTHVSADDRLLCIPLLPEAAFAGSEEVTIRTHYPRGFHHISERARQQELHSELLVIRTDGTSAGVWGRQRSWITHVQFNPVDPRWLLFNNEAIGDKPGDQRMWLCDGETGAITKVRPQPMEGRFWISHENWSMDGTKVFYHGGAGQADGSMRFFFGTCDRSGSQWNETFLRPEEVKGVGHFTEHPQPGHVLTDGYFGDSKTIMDCWRDEDGYARWQPVCRHGSNWIYQDDHPHPIWSPGAQILIFSSSKEGVGNVYGVRL